jgi:hypothetical protein
MLLDHLLQVLIQLRQFSAHPSQVDLDPLPDPRRGQIQSILHSSLHRQYGRLFLRLHIGTRLHGQMDTRHNAGARIHQHSRRTG